VIFDLNRLRKQQRELNVRVERLEGQLAETDLMRPAEVSR